MNLHIRIKDIKYTRKERYGLVKTKCIIRWINPITGNTQRSIGTTCKNPNDVDNNVLACRIAESRAKINMWREYKSVFILLMNDTRKRYNKFIDHEINHVNNLINNN